MEDNLKILNVEYLEFLGGNYRKTQRKSKVWLCSAELVIYSFWMEKRPNTPGEFHSEKVAGGREWNVQKLNCTLK
jgi:hypothetical protein